MLLQESPAWPALVEACAAANVRLALLNARMSSKSFLSWFNSSCKRALLRRMLDNFSLIVPQSDIVSGSSSSSSWCLQLQDKQHSQWGAVSRTRAEAK